MNYKKILERIDFWKKEDEKLQAAVDKFIKVVCPDSYAPFVENSAALWKSWCSCVLHATLLNIK